MTRIGAGCVRQGWLRVLMLAVVVLLIAGEVRAAYTSHGNGTVSDTVTGLMWQQQDDNQGRSWEAAITYCQGLELAGFADWRLPDVMELASITDDSLYSPAIDSTVFPGTNASYYWSSTSYASYSSYAWHVNFYYGSVYNYDKTNSYYVRCVRSGAVSWPFDHLTGIQGTVTDGTTGLPLAGAVVAVTAGATTVSDDQGHYALTLAPETYTLTFAKEEYPAATRTSVAVVAGQATTLDVTLSDGMGPADPTVIATVTGGNGTVTCTTPTYNGASTCTITPATGYQLATLTDNGVDKLSVVSGTTYIINNVTGTHTINATFTIQTFTIPVTVTGGNGTVTCTASVYNGAITCTITPADGYQLATLTDNGENVVTSVVDNSYIINNVTATHTIEASFSAIPQGPGGWRLLFQDDFNATTLNTALWTPHGQNVVQSGGHVSIQENVTDTYAYISAEFAPTAKIKVEMRHYMHPTNGYFFPSVSFGFFGFNWLRSGYSPDYCNDNNGYDKVMVKTANATNDGSLCLPSDITASTLYDQWITSYIIYDSTTGKVEYDLAGDGGIDFTTTIPNNHPVDSITISGYGWWTGMYHNVDWIKVYSGDTGMPPNITATVTGGNGTVTCTAPTYNGTSTCTITPATGYQLATLTDNGADVFTSVAGNTYIITNVTESHTIDATFDIQTFTMLALPFNDDVEAGTNGWSATGFWHRVTNPQSIRVIDDIRTMLVQIPDAGYLPQAYSGTACWWFGEDTTGTFIGADYDTTQSANSGGRSQVAQSGHLVSPVFDLTGVSAASLSFYTWWEIEGVDVNAFDMMYIDISTDGGTNFTNLGKLNPIDDANTAPFIAYSTNGVNQSGEWGRVFFDLTPYAGNPVVIRFHFESHDPLYNGFRGWFVDDISVSTAPLPNLTLTSVKPPVAKVGELLTLTGTGFHDGATVQIGSFVAETAVIFHDKILAYVPSLSPGVYDVTVTNPDSATATLTQALTVSTLEAPTITSVSPDLIDCTASGTVLTINGSGFVAGATVKLDNVPLTGVTFIYAAQLTADLPASLGPGYHNVTVVNPDGLSTTKFAAVNVNGGASLAGHVYKTGTTMGIAAAEISYTGPINGKVYSKADGTYKIDGLIIGSYSLTVKADGYQTKTLPAVIDACSGVDKNITITKEVPVDGICGSANNTVIQTIPTTNLCDAAEVSAITGTGPWYWSCVGNAGGETAYCSANITESINETINQIDIDTCPLVKLYVTVVDYSGRPVAGLTTADFTVTENDVVQTPITVSSAALDEPISVGLTLDYSGTMSGQPTRDMQNAAVSFINQLGTEDAAEIVKFSKIVRTVKGFTSNKATLSSAVKTGWSGAGQSTALYDAIYQAVNETSQRQGRKAVIAMTDGYENASIYTLDQVTNLATVAGVPVFTIGLGDVDTAELQNLATSTGGQYYYAPTSADLQAIYDSIAAIINNQYIITYNTTTTSTTTRTVTVDVTNGSDIATTSKVYSGCAVGATSTSTATATAGVGGSVTPGASTVANGTSASFPVIADPGYTIGTTVGGTCLPGSWSGDTYTTGPIDGDCSVLFSFIPPSCAPPVTVTVPAADADGGYVVKWTKSTTTGMTYVLEEATDSTFTEGLRTVPHAKALNAAITGRETGKTYYYRVRAEKGGWTASTWTPGTRGCAVKFQAGTPGPVTVPTTDADGSYQVSWTASATPGVTYVLQEATNSTFTTGKRTVPHAATLLSAKIKNRIAGKTYYYRVYAKKSGYKNSAWKKGANGCAIPQ